MLVNGKRRETWDGCSLRGRDNGVWRVCVCLGMKCVWMHLYVCVWLCVKAIRIVSSRRLLFFLQTPGHQ